MIRTVCAAVAGGLLLAACAETKDVPYNEKEQLALRAWMELNRPDLLENYQSEGGYYVDVFDLGSAEAAPIRNGACWVRFTFTGRNLAGDIVLTRNEVDARQVGSYTPFTHYVPFYKYYAGDEDNTSLLEGTYLAMRNPLTLGTAYATAHGYPLEIEMRYGTKVTLYMPSSVVGAAGVGGSGGYEGQGGYELRSGQPFIVTMQITDRVANPLEQEGTEVDGFASRNGKLKPPSKEPEAIVSQRQTGPPIYNPDDPYNDGYAWRYADNKVPQVYMNLIYEPTTRFTYSTVYKSQYAPYSDFEQLERNIIDTLVNRFGPYEGPEKLPQDKVTDSGTAKIWYIGRFLDGFIFDTNIPGVRHLIYGEPVTEGEPLEYTPRNGGLIEAFYLTVPQLIYGQWAALVTSSTYAYGAIGRAGKTSTTTTGGSNSNAMFDYYNYANSLYNYGSYYDSYYGSYMSGQFADSYYYNPGEPVTTTTVSTEIPPFTPLLFEFYIEPQEK